jgi:acid phosphatase family membrane protein YuiD
MATFFADHLFYIPVIAWIASVAVKGSILAIQKRFVLRHMFGSGGMPSVHSALVTSLSTAIGIKYSILSDLFLVSLVFSCIIIYDAMNVRFEAGRHARALNILSKKEQKEFNESIGHLPKEAFAGSCIGILTAVILLGF